MCEIQIIKRYNGNLNIDDINEFEQMLKYGSLDNNDAFGLFNKDILYKKEGSVDFTEIDKEQLTNCPYIVGHNRLTTSGKQKFNHNNHPFILNDFILVHNGIITNDDELRAEYNLKKGKIETDSYIIIRLIDYFIKKGR